MDKLFTNEIVFRGHPDKVCDQISGAILDACLLRDKSSMVAIEVVGGKNIIFVTGEISCKVDIDLKGIVKRVLCDVGYSDDYKIIVDVGTQSNDIAVKIKGGGAGDQGMMFGYACRDTEEKLPVAQVILQKFAVAYDSLRKIEPEIFYPDGKAQITGLYSEDFKLLKIKDFVISFQNSEEQSNYAKDIVQAIAKGIVSEYGLEVENWRINVNGKFLIGGFKGDAGLTGRKIVVDSYQSFANCGGGCMNGKDPSKVDVSGAYKARQLACQLLDEFNLDWCEVQISYAIGEELPLSIYIDSEKGNIEVSQEIYEECKPNNIIKDLCLLEPKWEKRARYGHFMNKIGGR